MNEAELLFSEMLNCNRLSLYLNQESRLDRNKSALIASVLKRRISGEPLQYILGKTEFMGLEFKLNKDVFIPRPETEILVEKVIEWVSKCPCLSGRQESVKVSKLNILDLGTGSGCIAISLAKLLSNVTVIASDISQKAIEIAWYNALLNNVTEKIRFIESDLFTEYGIRLPADRQGNTEYDIIVSNPPYISTIEIDNLQPEIRYEPRVALDGGSDGLDFYREIINNSSYYLKDNGFLIMEIGFHQRRAIENIFKNYKYFKIIEVVKDYNNIDRVIIAGKVRKNG